jgi:hypothetical protein
MADSTETAGTKCPWCKTDPAEAKARHEGPHATWCVHFRVGQTSTIRRLREALEAVQAEVLLSGHLGEIVESALHE